MREPIFILSFRHRDELSRLAEGAGWRPVAARRVENAESRFVDSRATVAVIDARGAPREGEAAARAIADAAETNSAALLILLSRKDGAALETFHALGATHFLVSPFSEQQLVQAFRFARRHADRIGGERNARRAAGMTEDAPAWRWRPGSRFVELSPALARRAGLGDGERRIALTDLFRKLDGEGRRSAREGIRRLVATGEAVAFAHRDPEEKAARIVHHVRKEAGGEDMVGSIEIIRGGGAALAGRDALTGLADKRAARAWLTACLADAAASKTAAVILVSVSRYDAINAAFGRPTGDAVLQAAARRIERLLEGRTVLAARMAGAEFAILLAEPDAAEAGHFLAGRIIEAISRPFISGEQVISLGSRAGVAAAQPGDDPASLLRRASAALAEAKENDASPVRVRDGRSGTARDESLEIDLRRALTDDEIEVRFQPQVSIATGEVVGAEALARWNHPRHGSLDAAVLFTVAERSEYLAQLSDHVQRKAIAAAAAWPEELRTLRLSVNITAADIVRPGFAERFLDLLRVGGIDPGRITVEVTESGLIEDLAAAAVLLARLREGGLSVAIDDFGTGYSSLAYLKMLPLDYLKLDKRLSQDIAGSARDRIVVRGAIDMARSLGLAVIAEGVETEEQLELLAKEGCNLYQGFLCAPPLTGDELVQIMSGDDA